jgi:AcrR family transcriptional regulator
VTGGPRSCSPGLDGRGALDGSGALDGRAARRARNRDAVVDALLALYDDGDLHPGADAIAARAGLSPRSVFRYFDDVDDLCRAAVERQQERVADLLALEVERDAPLAARVAATVEHRQRLFDAIGAVATVARLRAPFQPALATQLERGRRALREQLRRLFAPELAALGPTKAARVLAAVDVLCSFEAHDLLRTDQRLGGDAAVAVLTHALHALLAPELPEDR